MANYRDNHNTMGMSLNGSIGYNIAEFLKLQGTFAYAMSNAVQETFIGEDTYYSASLRGTNYGGELTPFIKTQSLMPYGGEYRESATRNRNYTTRLQANFNKYLDKDAKHQITASLGFELSSNKYDGKSQTHRCYLPNRGKTISAVDPDQFPKYRDWKMEDPSALGIISDNIKNQLAGYFTVSYSLDDAYTLNFNTRADASNKFGSRSNEKLLPVWSVSGSWDVKRRTLSNAKWVNTLQLRGSFGHQGNMLDSQTPELIIKPGGYNSYFEMYESKIKHYPNPNLKWEKTSSYNASLDFSFLGNRVRGTASYFYKKTKDAFLSKDVADINGVSVYVVNSGNIENKGFELSFFFTPIKSNGKIGGFKWDIDPQFGQILNKLMSKAINNRNYNDFTNREIYYTDYLTGNVFVEGRPLNSFYSYKFSGLSPEDGRPMFRDVEKDDVAKRYLKMDREEVFRTVMERSGTRVPVIQGGISNTFSYNRLTLKIHVAYSVGNKIRLMNLYTNNSNSYTIAPLPERNVRREFCDRWRNPGDENTTKIPGLLSNAQYTQTLNPWWGHSDYNSIRFAKDIWQMYDNSNLRVANGNYLKIQSFTLNYTVPDKICKKLFLKSAYFAFSGYNIYTWCSKELKGQDPVQSGTTETINLSLRPTYSMSLGLSF